MVARLLAVAGVCLVAALAGAAPAHAAFGFLSTFGTNGSGAGQFFAATGLAADAQGNVYVADRSNMRVQKFDADGNFLRTWGWGVQDGSSAFQVCTSACQAGVPGAGDGQLKYPVDVAVDSAGFVYVVEGPNGAFNFSGNDRVQKFDGDGNFVTKWGGHGTTEGNLGIPLGIAVDTANNVYVAETENNRVSKFTSTGTFVRMWGWGVDDGSNALQTCTSGCESGIRGYGAGQFFEIYGIAIAPNGQVYTLENQSNKVQRFDADGALFASFDAGEGPGQYYLTAIDLDAAGFVYITNTGGPFPHTFRRFTGDGVVTDRVVCNHTVQGVTAHPSGRVYVGGDTAIRVFGEGGTSGCDPESPPPPGGGGGGDGGGGGGGGDGGGSTGLAFTGLEGVTIADGARFTNDPAVTLGIVAPGGATGVRIANDGGFAGATPVPVAPDGRYQWTLDRDPSQDERLPKTVYVRFDGPGGSSALTFTDDIILDTIAPSVVQATLSGGGAQAGVAVTARARKRRFTLRVRARDNASGVARLQLARNRRRPARARRFRLTTTFRAASAPRFVRVRDRAGNLSAWRRLRARR